MLGIPVAFLLAIFMPDYFSCHPIHFLKSPDERRLEASETGDMSAFVRDGVRYIVVEYGNVTISTQGQVSGERAGSLLQAWEATYDRHHLDQSARDCITFVIKDQDGNTYASCQSLDGAMRLFANVALC
ncbi:MAG TPA: hypothetical protein VID24_06050 [Candidatus Eremiobacteraceae bacterium]